MILWDVNLWVYAFRSDSPLHTLARERMQSALAEREPFLFLPTVAASFLRLVTNPRIFKIPSTVEEAWRFITLLEEHPSAFFAGLDAMTFGIFKHLCLITATTGNNVPDAFLAASAIRHDAELLTADVNFARFPGLRYQVITNS